MCKMSQYSLFLMHVLSRGRGGGGAEKAQPQDLFQKFFLINNLYLKLRNFGRNIL